MDLRPKGRSSGYALAVAEPTRELLLAIRRDHPRVSASLIVRTLDRDGRLERGAVSEPTVRGRWATPVRHRAGPRPYRARLPNCAYFERFQRLTTGFEARLRIVSCLGIMYHPARHG
jgi:hypothetical protein